MDFRDFLVRLVRLKPPPNCQLFSFTVNHSRTKLPFSITMTELLDPLSKDSLMTLTFHFPLRYILLSSLTSGLKTYI